MFIYKDGTPTIEPKMLFVPKFRKIWDRDKSAGKKKAEKDFAFIYFMADFRSEYNSYGLEKEILIAEDIMGDKNYRADDLILEAIAEYEFRQDTYSMRYLKSLRKQADRLIKWNEKMAAINDKNYDAKAVTSAMANVDKFMEQMEKWERKILAEEETMQIRGGGKAGMFEDEDTASWIQKGKSD